MKILLNPPSSALALLAAFWSIAGKGGAATVIGNSLSDRGTTDSFSGQIFLLNANLNSLAGQTVSSWSFFNNQNGNAVTPLLVEDMGGGTFAVRGIGATIISNASGMQGGPFNLVSGTGLISLNHYVGYYDGSWNGVSATPNAGGVEWDFADEAPVGGQIDSTGTIWSHNIPDCSDNPANLAVGALNTRDTVHGGGVDGRHHSINFTAVPEPSAVVFGGLAGLGLMRRRR